MSIYLDELAELARYAGLRLLIRCGQRGALEIRRAALCYDFAFEAISWALGRTPLLCWGIWSRRAPIWFSAFFRAVIRTMALFGELTAAAAALGGQIACKDLDDAVGICMTLPLGGESCG